MRNGGTSSRRGEPAMTAVADSGRGPRLPPPWPDRFYDEDDAELVLAPPGRPRPKQAGDNAGALAGLDPARLARAVRRAVLDVDEAAPTRRRCSTSASRSGRCSRAGRTSRWRSAAGSAIGTSASTPRRSAPPSRRSGTGAGGLDRGSDYSYVLLHEAEAIISAPTITSSSGPAIAAPSSASAASRSMSACASRTTVAWDGRSRGERAVQILLGPRTRPA